MYELRRSRRDRAPIVAHLLETCQRPVAGEIIDPHWGKYRKRNFADLLRSSHYLPPSPVIVPKPTLIYLGKSSLPTDLLTAKYVYLLEKALGRTLAETIRLPRSDRPGSLPGTKTTNVTDFTAGIQVRFAPRLYALAGYRWFNFKFPFGPDDRIDNSLFAGMKWDLNK